jgi:hypothetical protein
MRCFEFKAAAGRDPDSGGDLLFRIICIIIISARSRQQCDGPVSATMASFQDRNISPPTVINRKSEYPFMGINQKYRDTLMIVRVIDKPWEKIFFRREIFIEISAK